MRLAVYTCLDCGHAATGDVRTAAMAAMAHQLEEHDRLQWRHYVTGTVTMDPLPAQPKLW